MAVKVFIRRKFKEGEAMEVFGRLNKIRSAAMDQPGYITGETLIGYDDPLSLVVIGTWQSIENWLKWKESPERKAAAEELQQYLDGPTQYEVYVFGTPPLKKK
jgi:heme-degrading monooxygenase HmoA